MTQPVRLPPGFVMLDDGRQMPAEPNLPPGFVLEQPQEKRRDLSKLSEGERRLAEMSGGLPNPVRGIPLIGPFLDEAAAGINAGIEYAGSNIASALGYGDGTTLQDSYDRNLTFQREIIDQERRKNPVGQPVAEIVGGVVTGGAAYGAGRGVGWAMGAPQAAATVPGRLAQIGTVGGTQAGNYTFGQNEGGDGTLYEQFTRRLQGVPESTGLGVGLGLGLGIVGEGVGRAFRSGQQFARPGQGAYSTVLDDVGDGGVDQLANQMAVGANPGNAAMQRQTLDMLGEEMVRANGDAAVAVPATIQRIMRETGVSQQAATARLRRLQSVHQDSELMFGEYPSVAGSDAAMRTPAGWRRQPGNVELDDIRRIEDAPMGGNFDYLANSGTGASAAAARNAVSRRQEQLFDSMRGTLNNMSPAGQTIDDTARHIENLTQLARQDYAVVYNPANQAVNYRALHTGLNRVVNRHLNRMRGRAGEQKAALERAIDELYVTLPNGQRLLMPDMQMLQDMRGAIRGQIEVARRSGANHIANTLQPLYNDLTGIMNMASPAWARANRRWADMNFAQRAQELGESFAQKAGPRFREHLAEFNQLAPQVQDIARVHFIRQMLDKVDNLGDNHDVAKLFNSQHTRDAIRTMFGPEAAVQFVRAVRNQAVATRTRNSLGNSRTHIRGMVQQQKDADINMVGSAATVSPGGVRDWLMSTVVNLLRERRNAPLAGIVTTPMRDTPQVAEHIARMRREQAARAMAERRSGRYAAPVGRAAGAAAGNIVGRRSE